MSKNYILWCTPSAATDLEKLVHELHYKYPGVMDHCNVTRTVTLYKIDTDIFSIRLADPRLTKLEGLCYDAIFGDYEDAKQEVLLLLKDPRLRGWFYNRRGSKNTMYEYIECIIRTTVSKSTLNYIYGIGTGYIDTDIGKISYIYRNSTYLPEIKNVIFNNPATIVLWADGTKTVVKVQNNESFDPEKGLAMAISKKVLGNKGNYYNTFTKWLPIPILTLDMGVNAMKNFVSIVRDHIDSLKKDIDIN